MHEATTWVHEATAWAHGLGLRTLRTLSSCFCAAITSIFRWCISHAIATAALRPRPDLQCMYTPEPRLRWCSMKLHAVRIAWRWVCSVRTGGVVCACGAPAMCMRTVAHLHSRLEVVDRPEPQQRDAVPPVRARRPLELVAQVDDGLDAQAFQHLHVRCEERRLPEEHRRLLLVHGRVPLSLELDLVADDAARHARPEVAPANPLAEQARQRMLLEGRIGRAAADAAEQQPKPEARYRGEVLADGGKPDVEDGLNCAPHTNNCIPVFFATHGPVECVQRQTWSGTHARLSRGSP